MSEKDTLFSDLALLNTSFPGLLDALEEAATKRLQALAVGFKVYVTDELSSEEKAQVKALESSKAQLVKLGIEGAAIDGLDKQIASIQGDKTDKAYKAYRAHMRPTRKPKSAQSGMPDNCVIRCPFSDDTLFVVVKGKQGFVYKIDADKAILIPLLSHLTGYAKSITSTSAARKLAHAQKNAGVPSDCKDGHGTRQEGLVGGTLAHVVSESPADWVKNPANMPLLPKKTE